jgi:hypothetical protein
MIATAFGTGVAQLTYTFDQAAFAATGAGQETTMAQPAKSVLLLSHHPDQWERLVAAPDLVPNAIEELLRGPARSASPGAGAVVPADGRSALATQPDPRRHLRAARLVSDRNAPEYWALADAEGNEADVASWLGRE